ncbi:hypothetical protein CG709_01730, partial [Lachnotalea glycerini]
MKNVFKRNQVVITALTIMIAAAFYLNYADKIDTSEPSKAASATVEEDAIDVSDISEEDIYAAANAEANSEEVLEALSPNGEEDIQSYDLDLTSDTASAEDVQTDSTETAAPVTEEETPGEAV